MNTLSKAVLSASRHLAGGEPSANLAVIPARGGSKRVPKKNIRHMQGRPLIAYTIDAALQSKLFARVVVTTDCAETAQVAIELGAEVPFLRDEALADDMTPVSAATLDALERLDPRGEDYSSVCQLMPNCPLRTAEDVRQSHVQFLNTRAQAQISVVRYGWQNPWWAMKRSENFTLEPLFPDAMHRRSQDLVELYCPTGAVWWATAHALREHGTFHIPHRYGCELPWQNGLDIDTSDDWSLAEALMFLLRSKA